MSFYSVKPFLSYRENTKMLFIRKTLKGKKSISFKLFFISYKYYIDVSNYNRIRKVFNYYF